MSQVCLRNDTHKFTKNVDDWRAVEMFPIEDTRHLRNDNLFVSDGTARSGEAIESTVLSPDARAYVIESALKHIRAMKDDQPD
jgi:hypothetical protein